MWAMEKVCPVNLNICRLCSEKHTNGYPLFNNKNNLSELINKYLPIKLTNDGKYPRWICKPCFIQLKSIVQFVNLIQIGQKNLEELYKLECNTSFDKLNTKDEYINETEETSIVKNKPGRPSKGLQRKRGRPRKHKTSNIFETASLIDSGQNNVNDNNISNLFIKTKSRSIKPPQRYQETLLGADYEKVYKDLRIINDNEKNQINYKDDNLKNSNGIIGFIQSKDGKSLGDFIDSIKYNNDDSLSKYRKTHFICDVCKVIFTNELKFFEHTFTSHKNTCFECVQCLKTFNNKNLLLSHQLNENHNEGTRITEKQKQKNTEKQMPIDNESRAQSSNINEEESQSNVSTSSLNFSLMDKLQNLDNKNQEKVTEKDKSNSLLQSFDKVCNKNEAIFICSVCNKKFTNGNNLKNHYRIIHSIVKPFKCNECGKSFKIKSVLMAHKTLHTGKMKYKCDICNQNFAYQRSLVLHKVTHANSKPFQCKDCGKYFTQYGNLKEHFRIHANERPFDCNICQKTFRTSSQLKTHLKRHQNGFPVKCKKCDKRFLNNDSLKLHLNRHLNVKPFGCTECNKTFVELPALKRHIRVHTGERPYVCVVCKKSFADPSNLKRHQSMHYKKFQNEQKQQENNQNISGEQEKELSTYLDSSADDKHTDDIDFYCNTIDNDNNDESIDDVPSITNDDSDTSVISLEELLSRKDKVSVDNKFHVGNNSDINEIVKKLFTTSKFLTQIREPLICVEYKDPQDSSTKMAYVVLNPNM